MVTARETEAPKLKPIGMRLEGRRLHSSHNVSRLLPSSIRHCVRKDGANPTASGEFEGDLALRNTGAVCLPPCFGREVESDRVPWTPPRGVRRSNRQWWNPTLHREGP